MDPWQHPGLQVQQQDPGVLQPASDAGEMIVMHGLSVQPLLQELTKVPFQQFSDPCSKSPLQMHELAGVGEHWAAPNDGAAEHSSVADRTASTEMRMTPSMMARREGVLPQVSPALALFRTFSIVNRPGFAWILQPLHGIEGRYLQEACPNPKAVDP